jgi:hypothetical protein
MKVVKIILLTASGFSGFASALYANSSSSPSAEEIENGYVNTLNASASLGTVSGYMSAADGTLAAVLASSYSPINSTKVGDAVKGSLNMGIGLSFYAVNATLANFPFITKLQGYLLQAQTKYPDSLQASGHSLQEMLYTAFMYIAGSSTNDADYWSAMGQGVASNQNIFDVILAQNYNFMFPIASFTKDSIRKAIVCGVNLTLAQIMSQPNTPPDNIIKFYSYYLAAQNKVPNAFDFDSSAITKEKIYCGLLMCAGASTTFDSFWRILSGGTSAGKNILDTILVQAYASQNRPLLVTSLTAAFNKGISLAATPADVLRFYTYLQQGYTILNSVFGAILEQIYIRLLQCAAMIQNASTIDIFWKAVSTVTVGNIQEYIVFDVILASNYTPKQENRTAIARAIFNALDRGVNLVIVDVTTPSTFDNLKKLQCYLTKVLGSSYNIPIPDIDTVRSRLGNNTLTGFLKYIALNSQITTFDIFVKVITDQEIIAYYTGRNTGLNISDSILGETTYIPETNALDIVSALARGASLATTQDDFVKIQNYLIAVRAKFTSIDISPANQALEKNISIKLYAVKEDLQFEAILELLRKALTISTLTTANKEFLINSFNQAFKIAISIATITQCDILNTMLTSNVPTWLSPSVANLQQVITARKTALQETGTQTQLIANLTTAASANKLSDITQYLTPAIAITTPLAANVSNLTTAFTNAFNHAISLASSAPDITTLTNCLPPAQGSYLSGLRTNLAAALTTKQQQLQNASDTTAKAAQETKLITDLKAATIFAALLPLLTTALAPTYTPTNATDITSSVVTAFNTAVTVATSLPELTQLSNLLTTSPAYISSNVQLFNTAITARQQQLQGTNNATTETTIIATLKSSTASLNTLLSNLDTVLAATYQPSNLTNLKAAVIAGITRAITLITTSNYTTGQPKITNYLSSATPKYLTTAQKTSLSTSLATKIKSIRTSLISSFTGKITSFTSAVTTAIATRTTPAATLAQRQTRLTSAIQDAATIIDAHTQLAPSTSELALANLRSAYTSFNASIIKLIQEQGFIKKTVSGQTITYTLAYNATAAEPKTSLKKVLNFMNTTSFPQLSSTQKNIITAINASIA